MLKDLKRGAGGNVLVSTGLPQIAAGPTASNSTGSAAASVALTIPAVGAGDVFLVAVAAFLAGTTVPTVSLASTGTTPVQIGAAQNLAAAGDTLVGTYWRVTAAALDAGKVLTASATINSFWTIVLADYSGVNGASPVDVFGFATPAQGVISIATPTLVTTQPGDWGILMAAAGLPNSTLTDPAGSTRRSELVSGSLIAASICDTNGPVASGGSIGGGSFGAGAAAGTWWTAMTLGLAA